MDCACGQPLHYSNPATRAYMIGLVKVRGDHIRITTPDGTWKVQRHYIALHGLSAEDLPTSHWEKLR